MTKKKIVACVAGAIVLVAVLAVVITTRSGGGDDAVDGEGESQVAAQGTADRKKSAQRVRVREHKGGKRVATPVRVKPDIALDAGEEASMTVEMLAIYRALKAALDSDDRKRVFALVRQLQSMAEWPDGIPTSVKKRALSALAWFGASGIAEAVGFLEDSSSEVRETAIETYEEQLADSSDIGDKALSQILVALSKVVSDAEALDSFYEQLDNMRPSVRASTVIEIYNSGNESAKQVLDKNLEMIFSSDDTEVKTREDVATALKDAQAEETADPEKVREYDEMYGPTDWDW